MLLEPEPNKDYEMESENHETSVQAANTQYHQLSSAPTDILASSLSLSESQPSTSTNLAAEERREPFVCESCGVSFNDMALFNIHNALHKDRPFNWFDMWEYFQNDENAWWNTRDFTRLRI